MGDDAMYNYAGAIKSPHEMRLNDNGTWNNIRKNIDGLEAYVRIITSGTRGRVGRAPNAAKTNGGQGGPLGNRFFIDTGVKCVTREGRRERLYSYIDNLPHSSLTPLRGLGPGLFSTIRNFDPTPMFTVMSEPVYPECKLVTLDTVDKYNNRRYKSGHLRESEIKNIDVCAFKDYKNPVTGQQRSRSFCENESFTVMLKDDEYSDVKSPTVISDTSAHKNLPDDALTNVYIFSISCLGIYLMGKMLTKSKK